MENPEFLRFATHWGFRMRACRPYRAQTKGKVERPIRYLRDSFLYGREFLGDADLECPGARLAGPTANARVHGTTHEVPRERFARDERAVLQPLPPGRYTPLVLPPARQRERTPAARASRPPAVAVERRPLGRVHALVGAEADA